ncbi:MAG: hypothetical protein ACI4RD_04190 [Kiritimatiellia bacterium]
MAMIRNRCFIGAFLCVVLTTLFVSWPRMAPQNEHEHTARRTLSFFYDPIMDAATGSVSQAEFAKSQELVTDALFHMRSAVNSLNREESRQKLVERFVDTHSEWADVDMVRAAFCGVEVDLESGLPLSALIVVRTPIFELSRQIADFYADEIMSYFRNENAGLVEKMSAWFECEKVGKEGTAIAKVEEQKRKALKKAAQKCMRVVP